MSLSVFNGKQTTQCSTHDKIAPFVENTVVPCTHIEVVTSQIWLNITKLASTLFSLLHNI